MKLIKLIPALMLVGGLTLGGCKPKDTDIKAAVETAISSNPDASGVTVMVNEGVATLTGEVKDDATKAALETSAKGAKGVKSVVNNLTVAPVAAPVVVADDSALSQGVKDATKDLPTVTATVNGGIVTLTGTIEKAKLTTLMQTLSSLKPEKIDNQLTVK